MSDLKKCPNCDHLNPAEQDVCTACGANLRCETKDKTPGERVTTSPLLETADTQQPETRLIDQDLDENRLRWGDACIDEHTQLLAFLMEQERTVALDIHHSGSVMLGRFPARMRDGSHVDLTAFSGDSAGVSRRHTQIDLRDYSLCLTDLGSTNGTYLNGLRVMAYQPRILRDGDEIKLGTLRLQVMFVRPTEADT